MYIFIALFSLMSGNGGGYGGMGYSIIPSQGEGK